MNEGFSAKAKATSKKKHEFRKISKLMDRRQAAVDAGDDETALKYSNKLHNYSTEGGMRNPKIAKMTTESENLNEKKMLVGLMKKTFDKISKAANASYEKGQKARGTEEEQRARQAKLDNSPLGAFRDRG